MDILKSKIILGFLLVVILTSCEKDEKNNLQSDNDYVKYGTSFNMCIGYCVRNVKISDSKIEFEKSGWDLDGNLPDISLSESINNDYWIKLVDTIDFDSFLQLDSVIGCPDCADGGAEWIEIKKNDKIYKVTFEYRNEPESVKSFIGYLRTYLASFDIDSAETVSFDERTLIDQVGKIKNFVCSRGCYQYLIELIENNDTSYYFDKYLDSDYQIDNLSISFNGVLQNDSTMINKPAPNDIPIPDFKVRNINTFDIRIISN